MTPSYKKWASRGQVRSVEVTRSREIWNDDVIVGFLSISAHALTEIPEICWIFADFLSIFEKLRTIIFYAQN